MISYSLTADDLGNMRFACSPLLETVTSLWALRWPERYVLHLPWVKRTRDLLAHLDPADVTVLNGLVGTHHGWLPDFLAPRPVTPLPDIATELDQVRRTAPAKAASDIRAVNEGKLPRLGNPASIASVLERYWQLAIAPHWTRMQALLEADMLYRARQMAHDSTVAMLTGLDTQARWREGTFHVNAGFGLRYDVAVAGRGLSLVPGLFVPGTICPVGQDEPPTIAYRARGIGTLWDNDRSPAPQAISDLIGVGRAGVLAALNGPATTTDLARRLGVTASAISQHLAVLNRAGLVAKARAGRTVLYARTEIGEQLASQPGGAKH